LGGKYIDYVCKAKYFHRPKFPELFDNEKIIVRGISGENNSLISVYYDNQFYSNHNLIHLILWNDKIMKLQRPTRGWEPYRPFDDFPLLYITGIINSQLISFFFDKSFATGTLQGTYTGVYPEDLRKIPIKKTSEAKEENICELVKKIIELNKKLNNLKDNNGNRYASFLHSPCC
jgi:hypothetical protein